MTKTLLEDADHVPLPTSSEDEEADDLQDADSCTPFELEQLFEVKYKIADESAVTLQNDYVLSLCNDSSFTRIAAGLSNSSVQIFDINQQKGLNNASIDCIPTVAKASSKERITICGVSFLDETPNLLLVGTTDGMVRLFDLRTQSEAGRFVHTSSEDGSTKRITCFDRNANGRILCTGTVKYKHNVFLIFYDIRERKSLGGYFDSHEDDVTSVRFHSQDPDLICSGSTDGLINIFDIKETSEDDALQTTINTVSSVHKLNWHRNVYNKDIISCITHTNDFHTYEYEEGDLVASFDRSLITSAMKRENPANCNLVDAHSLEDGGIFLLSGTNSSKGEILRSLYVQNKNLLPFANFEGNKQIVRESLYNEKSNALITAGESGIISLWTPTTETEAQTTNSSKLKSKTKSRLVKNTPY